MTKRLLVSFVIFFGLNYQAYASFNVTAWVTEVNIDYEQPDSDAWLPPLNYRDTKRLVNDIKHYMKGWEQRKVVEVKGSQTFIVGNTTFFLLKVPSSSGKYPTIENKDGFLMGSFQSADKKSSYFLFAIKWGSGENDWNRPTDKRFRVYFKSHT